MSHSCVESINSQADLRYHKNTIKPATSRQVLYFAAVLFYFLPLIFQTAEQPPAKSELDTKQYNTIKNL